MHGGQVFKHNWSNDVRAVLAGTVRGYQDEFDVQILPSALVFGARWRLILFAVLIGHLHNGRVVDIMR